MTPGQRILFGGPQFSHIYRGDIKSASHNYAGSDYVLQPDDLRRTAARERSTVAETLGFDPDPNTLQQRLNNEVWPT